MVEYLEICTKYKKNENIVLEGYEIEMCAWMCVDAHAPKSVQADMIEGR